MKKCVVSYELTIATKEDTFTPKKYDSKYLQDLRIIESQDEVDEESITSVIYTSIILDRKTKDRINIQKNELNIYSKDIKRVIEIFEKLTTDKTIMNIDDIYLYQDYHLVKKGIVETILEEKYINNKAKFDFDVIRIKDTNENKCTIFNCSVNTIHLRSENNVFLDREISPEDLIKSIRKKYDDLNTFNNNVIDSELVVKNL